MSAAQKPTLSFVRIVILSALPVILVASATGNQQVASRVDHDPTAAHLAVLHRFPNAVANKERSAQAIRPAQAAMSSWPEDRYPADTAWLARFQEGILPS